MRDKRFISQAGIIYFHFISDTPIHHCHRRPSHYTSFLRSSIRRLEHRPTSAQILPIDCLYVTVRTDFALSDRFSDFFLLDSFCCHSCVCTEGHYVLPAFFLFLFFKRSPWRSSNGIQPNFVTCSEVSQILKRTSKFGVPPPKTWGPKAPIFKWLYDDIVT